MANDVADWTSSVVIQSGSVNITGIASVSITGQPVNVGITGANTVILGAGTASVGSISAIGSTVTVAGTINIGNVPAVTINSGSVTATISGTPNVNIASQTGNLNVVFPSAQAVTISGTPNVAISGTVNVAITSGTVGISGTVSINIAAQAVNLNVQQPQTALADLTFPTGTSTQTTAAVPAGTYAIAFAAGVALTAVKVAGHVTGGVYFPPDPNEPTSIPALNYVVVPVDSVHENTYDITATNGSGGSITMKVVALLTAQAVAVFNKPSTALFVTDVGQTPLAVNFYDGGGNLAQGTRSTFHATVDVALANPATDFFVIGGSATKTLRITRVAIILTATTAGIVQLFLFRRSTADTAGTAVAATRVRADGNSGGSAADVVVQGYTANPTVGTLVGSIGQRRVVAVVSPNQPAFHEWTFGNRPGGTAQVLRGTNQQLCASLNGAGLTGGDASIEVEWTEEP